MKKTNTQPLTADINRKMKELKKHKQSATIMFCDLVGSTKFKAEYGDEIGLLKTHLHNSTVNDISKRKHGETVKYIGDECMVVFSGENHADAAIATAKEIQKRFEQMRKDFLKGSNIYQINSKIGIHSGDVYFWKYEGSTKKDPQGETVDLAARLTSLAKANQILASEATVIKSEEKITSQKNTRKLRGCTNFVHIIEVPWGNQTHGVAYPPYDSKIENDQVIKTARETTNLARNKKYNEAVALLKKEITNHPDSFIINFYLGKFLQRQGNYTDALRYLETATQINPQHPAPILQKALGVWKKNCKELGTKIPTKMLDDLISTHRMCLRTASENLDYYFMKRAKGNLVYFLAEKKGETHLSEALTLCDELELEMREEETEQKAAFLHSKAYAIYMSQSGKNNFDEALALLEIAGELDKSNGYIDHLRGQIRYALNELSHGRGAKVKR
jgi:class 3 adenylate cyclase